ncbi:DUF58 domain-containing protein [Oceanobacillus senegalensis]|uniref:DUF58 domain-containing protein n=1 Tax=Oceanobacillus senegalensis TaxID=1936063 RepID=UPI000A309973|nr:DUF58 domain-containing protein [Oceanobacillus senegalensis]
MRRSLKLFGSLFFIFSLMAILFSYAMFQGGFVSWFLFTGFFPILLYQFLFLLYPMQNWVITRKLSTPVIRAGESISVTIDIKRKVPFPLYYVILEEVFSESLHRVDSGQDKYAYMDQPNLLNIPRDVKKAVFPGFKRQMTLQYTMGQVPRGQHRLRAVRVKTADIFGFVKKVMIFPLEDELLVHPSLLQVEMNGKISSFEQGATSASINTFTNTNVVTGVREYEPGDRFSWIDWKQTARKNKMMTKEFEQEKSTRILLVLDNCFYERLNTLAYEASIELTWSLMESIRRNNINVGMLSISGGNENSYFPMQRDAVSQKRIIHHLAQLSPSGNRPFPTRLKEQLMRMGSGDMVMVVTTNMDEMFKQTIQQMNKRMKKIRILYIESFPFIPEDVREMKQQLQTEGVGVQIITEEELVKKPVEVNVW